MANKPPEQIVPTLSPQQVRHVAKLSRLSLSDAQIGLFAGQLTGVLEHVAQLMELDVSQVEPMAHALDVTNALGCDQPVPAMPVEHVLENAPEASAPFFKVPKVLGDGSHA